MPLPAARRVNRPIPLRFCSPLGRRPLPAPTLAGSRQADVTPTAEPEIASVSALILLDPSSGTKHHLLTLTRDDTNTSHA